MADCTVVQVFPTKGWNWPSPARKVLFTSSPGFVIDESLPDRPILVLAWPITYSSNPDLEGYKLKTERQQQAFQYDWNVDSIAFKVIIYTVYMLVLWFCYFRTTCQLARNAMTYFTNSSRLGQHLGTDHELKYVCVFCVNQKAQEFKHVAELRSHEDKHVSDHERWIFNFPQR